MVINTALGKKILIFADKTCCFVRFVSSFLKVFFTTELCVKYDTEMILRSG